MEVRELYELTLWIQEHIVDARIPKLYDMLHNRLNENSRQGQASQPYETEREELLAGLRGIPEDLLTIEQMEVLDEVGIGARIGEYGAADIEDALFKNVIDIATAASRIGEAKEHLQQGIQWAKGVRGHLEKIVSSEAVDELDHDEVLIRVRFTSDAYIHDVDDLKKWSQAWWDIARGVTMIHDDSVESVRVIGASKGSLILALATSCIIAKTIGLIAKEVLILLRKVVEIRVEIEKLKSLQLSNESASLVVNALTQEIETSKSEKVDEIVSKVCLKLNIDTQNIGDVLANLKKSVSKILDFQEKGGELDFRVPDDADEEPTGEEIEAAPEKAAIRELAKDLRRLEGDIQQLSLGFDEESDPSDEQN
jgi:hypothetical protein